MDWIEKSLIGLMAIAAVMFVAVLGFAIADGVTTAEGRVVEKYYDDPDLICSKGCVTTDECWTLVLDTEPWWNSETCVSEEFYHTVKIGDTYRE